MAVASSSEKVSYTPLLVSFLVVAAFLIGTLSTKVQYLEKGGSALGTKTAPEQQTAPNQQPPQDAPSGKPKEVTDKDHIRGNKNAKVTLIEYSDLECPFCKNFHPTTNDLLEAYGDKIRLVYRHYPLPFHQNAQKEAEAAECVAELSGNDAFWNFVDKIFERTTANGTGFALEDLGPLAAEIGVDQARFQECLDSGKYEKLVKDQVTEGAAAGVSGTPSTFIVDAKGNNKLIVGAQSFDNFKAAIDEALKQ